MRRKNVEKLLSPKRGKKKRLQMEAIERVKKYRWKTGQSGNPEGRPLGPAEHMHPNSLANLRKFAKGTSGNPKGRPPTKHFTDEELEAWIRARPNRVFGPRLKLDFALAEMGELFPD